MHRPHRFLALLALALLGSAHALDASGIAPALETAFPPSVAYLDCPFHSAARTCVLVPSAGNVRAGERLVLDFLRSQPGVGAVARAQRGSVVTFHAGDTAYRLQVAPSKARAGMIAATLSYAFAPGSAAHAVCLQPDALFDFARLPTLTAGQYARMATAVTCHGADPTDSRGRTPLWDAVASGNVAAVRTLLRGGADPNHIADDGWTPLLAAGRNGGRPVLDALLQAGGDPTYIAPDGATLAALEPFNRELGPAPVTPDGDAVLPRIPGALASEAAGELAVATAAGLSEGAASAAATAGHAAAGATRPASAVHVAPGAQAAPAARAPASSTAAPTAAPTGKRTPGRRTPGTLPWLPLLTVLIAVAVVLAVLGLRRRMPARHDPLSDTATDWRSLARPKPLSRERRARRLEPAHPWNDPLA